MRFIGDAVVLLSYFPLLFKCKLSYYSHKLVSILVHSLTGVHIIFTMWNSVTHRDLFSFPSSWENKNHSTTLCIYDFIRFIFLFEEATNLHLSLFFWLYFLLYTHTHTHTHTYIYIYIYSIYTSQHLKWNLSLKLS